MTKRILILAVAALLFAAGIATALAWPANQRLVTGEDGVPLLLVTIDFNKKEQVFYLPEGEYEQPLTIAGIPFEPVMKGGKAAVTPQMLRNVASALSLMELRPNMLPGDFLITGDSLLYNGVDLGKSGYYVFQNADGSTLRQLMPMVNSRDLVGTDPFSLTQDGEVVLHIQVEDVIYRDMSEQTSIVRVPGGAGVGTPAPTSSPVIVH